MLARAVNAVRSMGSSPTSRGGKPVRSRRRSRGFIAIEEVGWLAISVMFVVPIAGGAVAAGGHLSKDTEAWHTTKLTQK